MLHFRAGGGNFTLNGVGIEVCQGRGLVKWARGMDSDHDALQCFVFLWLPIIPIRATHRFTRAGRMHESPIQHSFHLSRWTFVRRWHLAALAVGLLLLAISISHGLSDVFLIVLGLMLSTLGIWINASLSQWDQRARNIRRLLLPHAFGSSDPAAWPKDTLAGLPAPNQTFGTNTFADAVPLLLDAGEHNHAMWAARLSAATEDPRLGEELTAVEDVEVDFGGA